jgi:hypothetical protein
MLIKKIAAVNVKILKVSARCWLVLQKKGGFLLLEKVKLKLAKSLKRLKR